jgi:hypothetical protein
MGNNEYLYQPDETEPDTEELREKLRDYYGTAMTGGFPMAVIDLGRVETMGDEELRREAEKNGIR